MSNSFVPSPEGRDYWLEHPESQPKRAHGEYFRANGIDTPEFTDDPAVAAQYSDGVVIRSEHQLEYAGPSDLLASDVLEPGTYTAESLALTQADWLIYNQARGQLTPERLALLSRAYGWSEDDICNSVSFSFWEVKVGMNRFIFADPASPERYIVGGMARVAETSYQRYFHAITSSGQTEALYQPFDDNSAWPEVYGQPEDLISLYERIRNLPRFDASHCPIIELQSTPDDGLQWALQNHRGRSAQLNEFNDEDLPPTPLAADYVFGCTPPEGLSSEYIIIESEAPEHNPPLRALELEILARSGLPIIIFTENMNAHFAAGVSAHSPRSLWTKPPLCLVLQTDRSGIPEMVASNLKTKLVVAGIEAPVVELHVISDGRTAYIDLPRN